MPNLWSCWTKALSLCTALYAGCSEACCWAGAAVRKGPVGAWEVHLGVHAGLHATTTNPAVRWRWQ